jgi:hypothetical protein
MILIKIDSKITKWNQSNDKIKGKILESDSLGFVLRMHHPIHKSLLTIDDNVILENKATGFILDIDIISDISFDIDGIRPTTKELYEAYLKVKDNEDEVIWEELKEKHILIARPKTRRSFNHLESVLDEVIQLTYNEN